MKGQIKDFITTESEFDKSYITGVIISIPDSEDIEIKDDKLSTFFEMGSGNHPYYKSPNEIIVKIGDNVRVKHSSSGSMLSVDFLSEMSEYIQYDNEPMNDNWNDYIEDTKLRIGASTFNIPPLAIDVKTQTTIERVRSLRTHGTIKTKSGHSDTRVELDLYFNGVKNINDENNGLRALLAQFRRAPFLPVKNKFLNEVMNIHAITLSNMIVNTVPGFPNDIKVRLVGYKFSHTPYVPSEPFLDDLVNWDMFQWYYKKDLIYQYDEHTKEWADTSIRPGRLRAVSEAGMSDKFRIWNVPIHELIRLKARSGDTPDDELATLLINANPDNYSADIETLKKVKRLINHIESDQRCSDLMEANAVAQYIATVKSLMSGADIRESDGIEYVDNAFFHTGPTPDDGYAKPGGRHHVIKIPVRAPANKQGLPGQHPYTENDDEDFITLMINNKDNIVIPNNIDDLKKITTRSERTRRFIYNVGYNYLRLDPQKNMRDYLEHVGGFTEEDLSATMEEWGGFNHDTMIVQGATIAYQNTVTNLQVQAMDAPTHQYLGSQDTFIQLTIRTTEKNLEILKDIHAYCDAVSREFPRFVETGFLRIDHDLINLFGVENVLIDQFNARTVQGSPGWYDIELVLMDFNVMQKRIERSGGVIGTAESSGRFIKDIAHGGHLPRDLDELRDNLYNVGDAESQRLERYISLNEIFKYFDMYPDLDLPTWEELKNHNPDWCQNFIHDECFVDPEDDETDSSVMKIKLWDGDLNNTPNGGIYVDPDFYFYRHLPNAYHLNNTIKNKDNFEIEFKDIFNNKARLKPGEEYNEDDVKTILESSQEEGLPVIGGNDRQAYNTDDLSMEDMLNFSRDEIKRRIELCSGVDEYWLSTQDDPSQEQLDSVVTSEDRRSAWPPLEEIIDGTSNSTRDRAGWYVNLVGALWGPEAAADRLVGKEGYKTDEDIAQRWEQEIQNAIQEVAREKGIDHDILGSLFKLESNFMQLYPYNYIVKPTYQREQTIRGEPVQAYYGGRWYPVFGVGQVHLGQHYERADGSINIAHDGNPIDPVRIIYDYEYNIRYSVHYLKQRYNSINKFRQGDAANIMEFNDTLSELGRRSADPETGTQEWSPLEFMHRSIAPPTQGDSVVDQFAWAVATVTYEGFTINEALEGIRTQGNTDNPRAERAWGRWARMYGRNGIINDKDLWQPKAKETYREEVIESAYTEEKDYRTITFMPFDKAITDTTPKPVSVEHSLKGVWHDYIETDATNRMLRAFPTYHLMLIDEGRQISAWRMWDNFYGMNSIVDISLHKSRKNVADTCNIAMSNVYGGIGDLDSRGADRIDYMRRGFWEIINPFKTVTDDHLRLRDRTEPNLLLAPGSRISLRMGYGSNSMKLPLMFNGTIAEMEVGDMIEIIAQGDGIELTNKLPFGDSSTTSSIFGWGAEPRNLITKLMVTRSWPRELLRTIFGGGVFDERNNTGIVHFGEVEYTTRVGYSISEVGENIYPANYSGDADSPYLHSINPFAWIKRQLDEDNITIDLWDKTMWDIVQTCALAMPNYIACVQPVGFRSTLFYGMPHWGFVHDWRSRSEGEFSPDQVIKHRKPLQQWHVYTSTGEIIDNSIVASSKDMYTNIIGSYIAGSSSILGSLLGRLVSDAALEHDAIAVAYADRDIYPEFQRTGQIYTNIRSRQVLLDMIPGWGLYRHQHVNAAAIAVAQSTVRDYLKDMYQGELLVMGDPSVKPYDAMYLWDAETEMFGTCEVKQVVHHFSHDTGFVTSISPDLCVAVADRDRHKFWGWETSIAAGFTLQGIIHAAGTSATRLAAKEALTGRGLAAYEAARTTGLSWVQRIGNTSVAKKIITQATRDTTMLGLAKIQGWSSTIFGKIGPIATKAIGISGALIAAKPVAAYLVGSTILTLAANTVQNVIQGYADLSQCVVVNFLTLHGKEFSAGVKGHQGIVVGEQYNWMGPTAQGFIEFFTGSPPAEIESIMPSTQYHNFMLDANEITGEFYGRYDSEEEYMRATGRPIDYTRVNEDRIIEYKYAGTERMQFKENTGNYRSGMPELVVAIDAFMSSNSYNVIVSSTWEPQPSAVRPVDSLHNTGYAIDIAAINEENIKVLARDMTTSGVTPKDIGGESVMLDRLLKVVDNANIWNLVKDSREFFNALIEFGNKNSGWTELYGPWGLYRWENGQIIDLIQKYEQAGVNTMEKDLLRGEIVDILGRHLTHIHIGKKE